jgi:hypothetical protein
MDIFSWAWAKNESICLFSSSLVPGYQLPAKRGCLIFSPANIVKAMNIKNVDNRNSFIFVSSYVNKVERLEVEGGKCVVGDFAIATYFQLSQGASLEACATPI